MAINYKEVEQYLQKCGPDTKIYLGCDSRVFLNEKKERMVSYTTAIVIHIDGCRGGKLFHTKDIERDYSPSRKKPSVRLMSEVYKVSGVYLDLIDQVDSAIDKDIEIHLDINVAKEHKSSAVVAEALGYIQGVCQSNAKVKPEAWAASTVADAF